MTCNYLVQAQLHTLALVEKWAVKTIIEQLRYSGNKEVKRGLEMQMKCWWSVWRLVQTSLPQLH